MKPDAEIKILNSFLEIIEDPEAKEKSCRRISKVLFTFGMLSLLFLSSGNYPFVESRIIEIGIAVGSGLCFGVGFWFAQMGFQTKLITQHLSKKSINERIEEINP